MGLSSSQARLLNLTARMHDIEYKAQNLEAQKLQMANESTQVYKEYEDALNKQKVQFKQIGSDGAANYVDADLEMLLENGYKLNIMSENDWIAENEDDLLDKENNLITVDGVKYVAKYTEGGEEEFTAPATNTTDSPIYKAFYGKNIGNIVSYNGYDYKVTVKYGTPTTRQVKAKKLTYTIKLAANSPTVLRNLVEAGYIVFNKKTNEKKEDGTYKYAEVNIATDTSLQEVSDETELKKAEAKYEADMRKIDAKDKKFDTDLAAMETERNAIKTEMDTLKGVAKDNVDRTFKLFG